MNKGAWWNCIKISSCYGRKPESENQQTSFRRLSLSDVNNPSSPLSVEDISNSFIGAKLHIFTYAELRVVTQHFSRSNLVGEGGFGPVYKGFIDDKLRAGLEAQAVAVKSLDLDGVQGHSEWMAEIIFLGQLQHPHLVKLIGYCCEDDERLLVYEYMPRGSLENQLFTSYSAVLPWSTRMKIALGAAKGLAFLHETDKPVIYRDFKSSNILLDTDYTAKLSDFGLAKDGPEGDQTHITTRVMGTHGYAAPEYIMTGRLTTMSDVYSFGVVLLELLTGKRSVDGHCRPGRAQSLVEWGRPLLKDSTKLERIIDVKLEGQYSINEAQQASRLAYKCLSHHPKARPAMSCVVKILELLQGFDDTFQAPFVYVVPNESVERKCRRTKDGVKSDEDNGGNRQQRSWRLRIKLPLPIVAHSDFSVYQSLENASNFPSSVKKEKKSETKRKCNLLLADT